MNEDKNLKAIYKALPYLRVSLPLHISEFMFLLFSSSDSENFPNPLTISLLLANLSLPHPEYSFLFKLLTTHLACVCGQTSCSSMPLIKNHMNRFPTYSGPFLRSTHFCPPSNHSGLYFLTLFILSNKRTCILQAIYLHSFSESLCQKKRTNKLSFTPLYIHLCNRYLLSALYAAGPCSLKAFNLERKQ